MHTSVPGQRPVPSSTWPLQSLSRLSHFSGVAVTVGLQTIVPPPWHCVTPSAQTPCSPVLHGTPPPLHVTPVNLKTLSLKSPSSGQLVALAPSQSSQAM